MPDGIHEGSLADSNDGNTASTDAWRLSTKSVGSHIKMSFEASESSTAIDTSRWAESRILAARASSFGVRHKTEKQPEKTITDATPKAKAEKKIHPYDHFVSTFKKGDPVPLVPPGHKMVVCRLGPNNNDTGYGLIKDPEKFVVNGQTFNAKSVLGMTLGDDLKLPNLLLRIARSRNIPFDDQGRLRCPEETPGGGQFTDLQLSNCMIPSARTVAGGAARAGARVAKQSINGAVAVGLRATTPDGDMVIGDEELSLRKRLLKESAALRRKAAYQGLGRRSLISGRRSLRSARQMKKAMRESFPNVPEKEIDDFLNIPLEKFSDAEEVADYVKFRWGFIEAFLLEAYDNREWSQMLGSMKLVDAREIGGDLAQLTIDGDGMFGLLMAPEQLRDTYRYVSGDNPRHLFATPPDMRTFGHEVGTHEFGHFADFRAKLNQAGITETKDMQVLDTETGELVNRKVLDISSHPNIKPLVDALPLETDETKREQIVEAIYSELYDLINPSQGIQDNLKNLANIVGSEYSHATDKSGNFGIEANAEFYAAYKMIYSLLADADPGLIGAADKNTLEKIIQKEFADRFNVPVDADGVPRSLGGPRFSPQQGGRVNRARRRTGALLSDSLERRNQSQLRNQGSRYRSPKINNYASDISTVNNVRQDGRTGEFYASRPQSPKEKGQELDTVGLKDSAKDILVDAADTYLGQLKQIFRQRMGLSAGDDIGIDEILDSMAGFEKTDGKQFGVWAADLHNMIILDRLMSSGQLNLINDVKRDGRYRVFKLMGLNVGQTKEHFVEIEAKAMPRKMRRIGRLLTARFDPRAEDGDGDGLVQDSTQFERPVGVASVSEKLREAEKGPISRLVPKKSEGSSLNDIEQLLRDMIDEMTSKIKDWSIADNDRIKQTPSMSADNVRKYVDNTISSVESKYGPLRKVSDAKSALAQIFREIKLTGFGKNDRDLTNEEISAFAGVISVAMQVPELKDWGYAIREQSDSLGGLTGVVESDVSKFDRSGGIDRSTSTGAKWLLMELAIDGSLVRQHSGDSMRMYVDPRTGKTVPVYISNEDSTSDNIGTQIMKTAYSSGNSGMSKAERRQIHSLAQTGAIMNIAHHEMAHALAESLSYDESMSGTTALERDKAIVDTVRSKAKVYAKQIFTGTVVRQILPAIKKQADGYEAVLPKIEEAILELPLEIAKLEVSLGQTKDVSIAKALQQQRANYINALANLKAERIIGRNMIDLRDLILDSEVIYAVVPFEPDHPLYGKDMSSNGKNIADEQVTDAIMAILTDPIFMEDVRESDIYKEFFPDDPVTNVQLTPSNSYDAYSYDLDIAKFYDPSTQVGIDGYQGAALREISQRTWDGITDPIDRRALLDLAKLFSSYGSKRPYYGGLMLEPGDIEPQEIFAELHALLMAGHGIKDYMIPEVVKQNIVKWLDWAYRGRRWVNTIHPDATEVLGIK